MAQIEKRKLITSAALASAIPFVIFYFPTNPIEMILALGLLGVFSGAVFVQSSAMIAELSPKGKSLHGFIHWDN